jgi:hypothetical protein
VRGGLAILALALAACGAGTGEGLDENGQLLPPGGGGPAPLAPTLASIQANIFTPTCAVPGCHGGAAAQQGLRLDPTASWGSLFNVASSQYPFLRVKPGMPGESLLILKLEGDPRTGNRMPDGGPDYLQQSTIDVIKTWIQDGALP